MGNALSSLGRKEEAMEWYRKAIALNPNYADPHNGMGVVLSSLGRKEEAERYYCRAIELKPWK
jgi:protein O-GlcNAc transferase